MDFDALSRSYPNQTDWGPKVLSAMFKGTQHVTMTAKIQSENAGVRVNIESVVVGSMTVPNWLVDYIILNVLQPKYHFDLSKPLAYPDHVTQIVLGSGQVTFLRGPDSIRDRMTEKCGWPPLKRRAWRVVTSFTRRKPARRISTFLPATVA